MEFNENLKYLRKEAKMTQESLAERLNVSRQAVTKWERGQLLPDIQNLKEISNIFGVIKELNYSTAINGRTQGKQIPVCHAAGVIYNKLFMDRMEIRQAALKVKDRYSLLTLLNRLKEDDLGGKTYPFTIEQLNYFCHPARNAGHYINFKQDP